MSTQRLALTGLLIIALLAPGASASLAEPASKANSAFDMPAGDDYPPPDWTFGPAIGTLAAAGDLNGDGYGDALLVELQDSLDSHTGTRLLRLACRAAGRAGLGAPKLLADLPSG